jgi:hypothetical protein
MAEQSAQDVVNQAQSVGESSLSDVPASNTNDLQALGAVQGTTATTILSENTTDHDTAASQEVVKQQSREEASIDSVSIFRDRC